MSVLFTIFFRDVLGLFFKKKLYCNTFPDLTAVGKGTKVFERRIYDEVEKRKNLYRIELSEQSQYCCSTEHSYSNPLNYIWTNFGRFGPGW